MYYKVFREDGKTLHDHNPWPLPQGDEPGAWVEVEGDIVSCKNELHVMREQDLAYWPGLILYEVEIDGESIEADDKVVCRRARLIRKVETWDHRTLVTWACDCAERTLPIFEKEYPEDKRPRDAIKITRAWLAGKATLEEVNVVADAVDAVDAAFSPRAVVNAVRRAASATAYLASYAAASAAFHAAFTAATPRAASAPTYHATSAATYAAHATYHATASAAFARASADADVACKAERAWQSARMLECILGKTKP